MFKDKFPLSQAATVNSLLTLFDSFKLFNRSKGLLYSIHWMDASSIPDLLSPGGAGEGQAGQLQAGQSHLRLDFQSV